MAFTVLCACASSKTQEIKTTQETLTSGRETTASETVTTRTEGPERTIVLEFAPPSECKPEQGWRVVDGACVLPPSDPDLSHSFGPTFRPHRVAIDHPNEAPAQAGPDSLPPHGALLKATIIERGPVLTESHATASGASETSATGVATAKASLKEESHPATGCVLGLGFCAALALCVILVLAWKLRKVWLAWL